MLQPTKRELQVRINALRHKLTEGMNGEECAMKTIEECLDRAQKMVCVAEWLAAEFCGLKGDTNGGNEIIDAAGRQAKESNTTRLGGNGGNDNRQLPQSDC